MELQRFFGSKLYGVRRIINQIGDLMPERSAIQFRGVSVYDDSETSATVVEIADITAAQHGNLPGGPLHANASALASGFMSSADKVKLDAATSANTASAIMRRDAGGSCSLEELKAEAIESAGATLTFSTKGTTISQMLEATTELRTSGLCSANTFETLADATLVRFVKTCPSADPAHWKEAGTSKWTNLLASAAAKLIVRLDLPNGAILTAVSVRIDPPAHESPPAVFPTVNVYRFSEFSSSGSLIATFTDPGSGYSLPDTTYDAAHTITCPIGFGGEVIDNSASRYYIELVPESSTNSLTGTEFLWARTSYTLPAGTNIGEV